MYIRRLTLLNFFVLLVVVSLSADPYDIDHDRDLHEEDYSEGDDLFPESRGRLLLSKSKIKGLGVYSGIRVHLKDPEVGYGLSFQQGWGKIGKAKKGWGWGNGWDGLGWKERKKRPGSGGWGGWNSYLDDSSEEDSHESHESYEDLGRSSLTFRDDFYAEEENEGHPHPDLTLSGGEDYIYESLPSYYPPQGYKHRDALFPIYMHQRQEEDFRK